MNQTELLKSWIVSHLSSHRGRDKALRRSSLLAMLNAEGFDIEDRYLRKVFALLIEEGYPFGSSSDEDSGGYFVILDREDLNLATAELVKRIAALSHRKKKIEENYYANGTPTQERMAV